MKTNHNPAYLMYATLFLLFFSLINGCKNISSVEVENESGEKYDGPALRMEQEFNRTKDPSLNTVPRERLTTAIEQTILAKNNSVEAVSGYGTWIERGPVSDAVGTSNGNTRANSGIAAGRVRAVLVDAADASGNKVWVGGVNGGLWKTNNITVSPANWTLVNDFFSNMAITTLSQHPGNANIMYFGTGEGFFNADAVRGDGIFKSTDNGVTWNQLASTTGSNFDYCTKILCDASGNVYVTTRSGVYRSTDGGTSWIIITPAGIGTRFSDMELSSTGRLHVSSGIFTTCGYRYTDNPSTVTTADWTSPAAGYPASPVRIELACSGNVLYALPSDASYMVPFIYKSTDGGANWAATTGQPIANWGSGQAWYNLAVDIDDANTNTIIVGALEAHKTTNGGANWTRISRWIGTGGGREYVHADIHYINIYGTNRVLFGCDGGIHYSSDGGSTIRDRNIGLRIKQFFSCAAHPTNLNYFLAGAQDNGSHQFSSAGLGSTIEVSGGDGGFTHIDQNEPQFQFTSYVFNDYFRSTNGGSTWSSVTLNGNGGFINPTDYDDAANIMYCGDLDGSYLRWTNPQTGSTNESIAVTSLNGNPVTAVTVSPYTSNRVYFGTDNSVGNARVSYVNAANTAATGVAGTNISTGLPTAGSVSCIATGTNDNNLMVSYSNYGVNSIWVSTNGGTSWTSIEGNLPDMPVRWCMFVPGNNTKALIATETGVWLTQLINGSSTDWLSSRTFPLVRTDMLQYRAVDGIIIAATHGRGLWTQSLHTVLPLNNFLLRARWNTTSTTELVWDFEDVSDGSFVIEYSVDGQTFSNGGGVTAITNKKNYVVIHQPRSENIFYRIKYTGLDGKIKFSNIVKLFKNNKENGLAINIIYPNPVQKEVGIEFVNTEKGRVSYSITNMSGQLVWKAEEELQYAGSNRRSWNQQKLQKGNYIFTISSGTKKTSKQFTKN